MRQPIANKLFTAILCLALIFKVLVPSGFMPDLGAMQRGEYKIVICTGHGPMTLQVNDEQTPAGPSHHSKSESGSHGDESCPFAGIHFTTVPLASVFLMALMLLWRRVRFRPTIAVLRSIVLTSAWPRGPPLRFA